jgi:hypothetical protein
MKQDVRKSIIVDITVDEVKLFETCSGWLFQAIKAALIQFRFPDRKMLKRGMTENMDILLQIPIPNIISLVKQRACNLIS